MTDTNLAMIGMSVMGSNFAMNFAEHGYEIAMFNRTDETTREAYERAPEELKERLVAVEGELPDLVEAVGREGTYFVMIKAGDPTQQVIERLLSLVDPGAVIVDCANSNWRDTERRYEMFEGTGVHFFGMGVSGGEEGARHGPSIMPGGHSREVYEERLQEVLEAVAAKAPQDGEPCVTYIGRGGAGHFVKMVHNGIEYADMELIAEAYDFMQRALGMSTDEIADVFERWNEGRLQSYLIEITVEVLRQPDDGGRLVEKILDAAQMKGTGTWTVMSSLELPEGVLPVPGVYSAVATRAISWMKDLRVRHAGRISFDVEPCSRDREQVLEELERALYVAKIACYAQGIHLMEAADEQHGFGGLDIAEIAEIWRAGCIIRARFLGEIARAYRSGEPETLILADGFTEDVREGLPVLAEICRIAAGTHVPFMAFDASRNYLLQLTSGRLPMNLTQAQRDYFGAHTYRRTDREGSFHTDWPGDRQEREV